MKKRLFSLLKYCTAATLVVALVTGLAQTGFNLEPKKAKAAGTSSVMGSDNYVEPASIEKGSEYSFGGYDWIAAEVYESGDRVVLQSKGVTSGHWPGYSVTSYNTTTQGLYNAIKYAEFGSSGLYLVNISKTGTTSFGSKGSGSYWQALRNAAGWYSTFGADNGNAWLGTESSVGGNHNCAWSINLEGVVDNDAFKSNNFVVAPAFNLDKSKVTVNSKNKIVPFSASTGIKATKSSIQSIEEGESIDLSLVIGGVTYTEGTSNGKNASYTVSCDKGTISGTTYIAPADVASNDSTVTFTIKSTRNSGWTDEVCVDIAQKYVSVSYDVATNGGTSTAPSSATVDFDKVLDASSPELTAGKDTVKKTGWTFVGWNTNRNAHTGLTSLKMDSDKTLYAIFKKDLTVTFIDAGS